MKFLFFIFLFSYSLTFELSDLFGSVIQLGKDVISEGNTPPHVINQYIDENWMPETLEEMRPINKSIDSGVVKDSAQTRKDTMPDFMLHNIILKDEDMLIHIKDGIFKNLILYE